MKKNTKILISVIAPLFALFTWYVVEKITIKIAVHERCSQFEIGDDWIGCVIDLALEKNDAKYCKMQGIFSPYPGLCMDLFSKRTQNMESCGTIAKPGYEKACLKRFD